jgi:hypothetical protein
MKTSYSFFEVTDTIFIALQKEIPYSLLLIGATFALTSALPLGWEFQTG